MQRRPKKRSVSELKRLVSENARKLLNQVRSGELDKDDLKRLEIASNMFVKKIKELENEIHTHLLQQKRT